MPDIVDVALFKSGRWYDRLIQWDTRRSGQSISQTPSHCAIIQDGILHEMVSTGYQCRDAAATDYAWSYAVTVPDPDALCHFLDSQYGKKYGWLTILEIMLCRLCPQKWFASTRGQKQQDCSWLVKSALEAGGWNCPLWLRKQYEPASPNDLLFAVRETLGETL